MTALTNYFGIGHNRWYFWRVDGVWDRRLILGLPMWRVMTPAPMITQRKAPHR